MVPFFRDTPKTVHSIRHGQEVVECVSVCHVRATGCDGFLTFFTVLCRGVSYEMYTVNCLDGDRVKEEVLHNAEEACKKHHRQVILTALNTVFCTNIILENNCFKTVNTSLMDLALRFPCSHSKSYVSDSSCG